MYYFVIKKDTKHTFKIINSKPYLSLENIPKKIFKAHIESTCGDIMDYIDYEPLQNSFESTDGTYRRRYRIDSFEERMDSVTVSPNVLLIELEIGNCVINSGCPDEQGKVMLLDPITEAIPLHELYRHEVYLNMLVSNSEKPRWTFPKPVEHPKRKHGLDIPHTWLYLRNREINVFRILQGLGGTRYYQKQFPTVCFYETNVPTDELTLEELVKWLNQYYIGAPTHEDISYNGTFLGGT